MTGRMRRANELETGVADERCARIAQYGNDQALFEGLDQLMLALRHGRPDVDPHRDPVAV